MITKKECTSEYRLKNYKTFTTERLERHARVSKMFGDRMLITGHDIYNGLVNEELKTRNKGE